MKNLISFIIFGTFLTILPLGQGLECFQCIYTEGWEGFIPTIPNLPNSKDCKSKDVPSKYKTTCSLESLPRSNSSVRQEEDLKWACGKASAKIDNNNFLGRGCIPANGLVTDGSCQSRDARELLKELGLDIPEIGGINVNYCLCDGDNCNSASGFKLSFILTGVVLTIMSFIQ